MGTPVALVHSLLTLLFVAVLRHGPARGVGFPGPGPGWAGREHAEYQRPDSGLLLETAGKELRKLMSRVNDEERS